jgi:hypothetical protein
VALGLSETGSLDLSLPPRGPAAGGQAGGRGSQAMGSLHTRPVMGSLSRPGNKVTDLVRCLAGAQANDSGWPVFNGKYIEYPRFRKEWWAYRQTYHGHVRDELVCRTLKEKSLASSVRVLISEIEDLREAWDTLDTCLDCQEKYILEAIEPIIKFRGYKAFNNGAVREFYSLLRSAMMGARKAGLLHRLINNQMLPGILAKMPTGDWKQWAKERPTWISGVVEDAFWIFMDQKWRDALNVAAAEPAGWGQESISSKSYGADRRDNQGKAEAKKLAAAAIHVATSAERQVPTGPPLKKCKFVDALNCTSLHPPWRCRAFGDKKREEQARIIEDNKLCPFCLLHDKSEVCYSKVYMTKPK